MVNLTIRLSKSGANSGLKPEHSLLEANEATLPQDFGDANLPVVKGIGFLFPETCRINFVGAKVQPKPGGKVHICLMCNFPIAVYGRLDPCQHVLCFACAKSDTTCYVCKEKVVRIQKVDVLVGIFICGVPRCLRSFLVRPDFELHVANDHPQQHQSESSKGDSLGKPIQSQIQPQQAGQQSQTDPVNPTRNSSANFQTTGPRKDDLQRNKDESRLQSRRRNNWEPSKQAQRGRESGNDRAHEGQHQRNRVLSDITQPSRKRERANMHNNSFQSSSKHVQQQTGTLPPPPPYPPSNAGSNYPPASFPPLNETTTGYPPRGDQFYPGIMAMQPRTEHPDINVTLQHAGPLVEWPLNFIPQEVFNGTANGCAGHMGPPLRPMQGMPQNEGLPQMRPQRPHFFPEFGLPMGMPLINIPRFREVGHLPPPPSGPPPKQQAMFNGLRPTSGSSLGELIVDYGWGPGNLSNFGGPRGGHDFTG